jgi:hypothetical protein
VTGFLADIGLILAGLARDVWNPMLRRKMKIFVPVYLSFLLGAMMGGAFSTRLAT